jgi:hypothetical protein
VITPRKTPMGPTKWRRLCASTAHWQARTESGTGYQGDKAARMKLLSEFVRLMNDESVTAEMVAGFFVKNEWPT